MGWLGSALGGAIGGVTSLIAGSQQRAAAEKAAQQGNQTIADYYNKAQGYLSPYVTAGQTGINAVQNMVKNPSQFTMSDFYNDPGYQFQLQQGNQALERSAAARGGLTSGATGKALAQYTTGLANQTYGDAYNRYLQTDQQRFNQANTLANYGYGASSASAGNAMNAGTSMANNLTSAITGGAAAGASGLVNAGNAVNGTLSDYYLRQAITNNGGYNPYASLGKVMSTANYARNPVDYASSNLTYGVGY